MVILELILWLFFGVFQYDSIGEKSYSLLAQGRWVDAKAVIVVTQMAVVHSLKKHLMNGRDECALLGVKHATRYAILNHGVKESAFLLHGQQTYPLESLVVEGYVGYKLACGRGFDGLVDHVEACADVGLKHFDRFEIGAYDVAKPFDYRVGLTFDNGVIYLLFILKIGIYSAPPFVGGCGYIIHGGTLHAVGGEELTGHIKKPFAGFRGNRSHLRRVFQDAKVVKNPVPLYVYALIFEKFLQYGRELLVGRARIADVGIDLCKIVFIVVNDKLTV